VKYPNKLSLFAALLIAHVSSGQNVSHETDVGSSETTAVDRTQYNLFNPTPAGQMRDFMPDRPSITDGPYTVDPGHWLVEIGLFEYVRDRYNNDHTRLDSFALGDTNIRLGIVSCAEVDFLFTAYTYARTKDKDSGAQFKQSGFSDSTIRSKINFYGDDGGPIAIGFIPFITLPSGVDGLGQRGLSGGASLPVQFNLPSDFSLGVESVVQSVHQIGGGSHFDSANSIVLEHPITKRLSTYVEFATEISTEPHQSWIGTIDTALIYQPGNDWQFDAGVNIGVTRAANDLFTFVGAAWRH
jgi:Putative MetA-pathway of phenol degradation